MTDSDDQEGIDAIVSDIDEILAGEDSEEQISFGSIQRGLEVDSIPMEEKEGSQVVCDKGSKRKPARRCQDLHHGDVQQPKSSYCYHIHYSCCRTYFQSQGCSTLQTAMKELKDLHSSMASQDGLTTDNLSVFLLDQWPNKASNVFNFFDLALDSVKNWKFILIFMCS